jgi:uncharacterized membrane protein
MLAALSSRETGDALAFRHGNASRAPHRAAALPRLPRDHGDRIGGSDPTPRLGAWRGEADEMRAASQRNDANRVFLLVVTVVTSIVIMVAVISEKLEKATPWTIALVLSSLALAWIFSNTIYALHYAHLYYLPAEDGEDGGGIQFPNCDNPDYWDFVYFSFTLGMTFQTSDVEIASRRIRRIVTGHCLAAFVFNLGVLAFTINSIGGS